MNTILQFSLQWHSSDRLFYYNQKMTVAPVAFLEGNITDSLFQAQQKKIDFLSSIHSQRFTALIGSD